uniref:Uncharacterized protein n=1 Tax=Romanomermis culicivorax TaxID=13658 RepID=A0A915IAC8_ROMCU
MGWADIVQLLLAKFPNLVLNSTIFHLNFGSSTSPLHLAAINGKTETIRVLLDAGFDINLLFGDDAPRQSSSEFNGHKEDTDSMRSTNSKKNLHVTWFGTYDNVPAIQNGSVKVATGDQIEHVEPSAANVKHVEKTPQCQPEPESENCAIVTQNEDRQWHEVK